MAAIVVGHVAASCPVCRLEVGGLGTVPEPRILSPAGPADRQMCPLTVGARHFWFCSPHTHLLRAATPALLSPLLPVELKWHEDTGSRGLCRIE